jgi:putative addiction module component (TIGR02574 family)
MNRTAAEILEEARKLPPNEREWVAQGLLIGGLDEIDPEWAGEVERRVADSESPDAATISWEELESRLRSRLSQ